jgi:hypothetical protein
VIRNPVKRLNIVQKDRLKAITKWQELVLRVGAMMSNACFNLSQPDDRSLTKRDRQSLRELWEAWDKLMAERPGKRPS